MDILKQDKRSATVFEHSTAISDIPVANGLTVDGEEGLSWRLGIRLRYQTYKKSESAKLSDL